MSSVPPCLREGQWGASPGCGLASGLRQSSGRRKAWAVFLLALPVSFRRALARHGHCGLLGPGTGLGARAMGASARSSKAGLVGSVDKVMAVQQAPGHGYGAVRQGASWLGRGGSRKGVSGRHHWKTCLGGPKAITHNAFFKSN